MFSWGGGGGLGACIILEGRTESFVSLILLMRPGSYRGTNELMDILCHEDMNSDHLELEPSGPYWSLGVQSC